MWKRICVVTLLFALCHGKPDVEGQEELRRDDPTTKLIPSVVTDGPSSETSSGLDVLEPWCATARRSSRPQCTNGESTL